MKTFFLILLFSTNTWASNVSLPSDLLNVDTIIDQFRSSFQLKLNDLYKNFITRRSSSRTEFSATTVTKCPLGETISAQGVIAAQEYQTKFSEGQIFQQASYLGCKGSLSLKETIISKGTNLKPIPWADISGSRSFFKLKANETERFYVIHDGQQKELFKAVMTKSSASEQTDIFVLNNKVLTMNQIDGEERSEIQYIIYPYKISFSLYGYNINGKTEQTSSYRAVAYRANNQIYYFNSSNQLISFSEFQTALNKEITENSIGDMGLVIKAYIEEFPKTNFVQTGVKNSVVLDELRLAFTRLTNNIEIIQVKNLVQLYIEAIEKGTMSIQDNRPKQ